MSLVLILGMHRSGTSCLAGSLQAHGVYLGEVHEWNPFNLKGNRENQSVVDLNNEVLVANGAGWDRLPNHQIHWTSEHGVFRDRVLSSLRVGAREYSASHWGFKDPRTLLVLPFWLEPLADFSVVATFRHPVSVAKSLHKRGGVSIQQGLELWVGYNTILLDYLKNDAEALLVCFDMPPDLYLRDLEFCAKQLGFCSEATPGAFFDNSLINQSVDNVGLSGLGFDVQNVYKSLMRCYEERTGESGYLVEA